MIVKKSALLVFVFVFLLMSSSCGRTLSLNGTYTYQGGHTTNTISISDYSKESVSASWSTYTDESAPLSAGNRTSGKADFVKISNAPYSTLDLKNTTWYESDEYYFSIKDQDGYTFSIFYKKVDGIACYVYVKQ